MFRILPALAALALPASPARATPADPAQITKALTDAERQWAEYDGQATGCKFATASMDLLQRRELALQRKLAKSQVPSINVAPAKPSVMPCVGPYQTQVAGQALINTFDWLTRLDFYSGFSGQPGWTAGIARMGTYAPGTHYVYQSQLRDALVKANSQQAIADRNEQLRQEVVAVLMLMCKQRRPKATDCPALPDALKGQESLAALRLAEIELAASQMIGIGKRDEIDAVGQAWRLQTTPADNSARCMKGDQVIFPHARRASRSVLPGQIMLNLRPWDDLNWTNDENPEDLVTVERKDGGYVLLFSPRLKVNFRDPVKRRFIACESF